MFIIKVFDILKVFLFSTFDDGKLLEKTKLKHQARAGATANMVNGRVYVFGGCAPYFEHWAESLDPFDENHQWVPIPSPENIRPNWMRGCLLLSGQLLVMSDHGVVAFDPNQESSWGPVPNEVIVGWTGKATVVEERLYKYHTGKVVGYDEKLNKWRPVLGLDILPKFSYGATLTNFDGVLCLIWPHKESAVGRRRKMMVDWAGIRVVDLGEEEGLFGSILWRETVTLGVPSSNIIRDCVVTRF
ncbi:hypothetical protein LUZ60_008398 [Juncus effusus]|nr:hypothetical protein LUZ60_008398 [Juncus effusus]